METTLYNKNGKPVAYLAEDGGSIYLWDGRPAAYVLEDKVFGWNGRQLGWYLNGTVFDIYGLRCGFVKTKSPIETEPEPIKPAKKEASRRQERQPAVIKPSMCYGYSAKNLEGLLEEGSFC